MNVCVCECVGWLCVCVRARVCVCGVCVCERERERERERESLRVCIFLGIRIRFLLGGLIWRRSQHPIQREIWAGVMLDMLSRGSVRLLLFAVREDSIVDFT